MRTLSTVCMIIETLMWIAATIAIFSGMPAYGACLGICAVGVKIERFNIKD